MAERPLDIPPGTRGPGYARAPAHRIAFVPRHARVRVAAAGTAIAKTSDVVAVEENGYPPRYYLARDGAWLDPVQLGGLLKSLTWAAVGALGKRSLKRSGLTRRLFAPGRDDARPRFASAHPSRPEFTR